jgi:hypothetical protein
MPIRGMYDTWISGSDVNSFCCYGLCSIPSGFLVVFEKPNRSSFTFTITLHSHTYPGEVPGPQDQHCALGLLHQCAASRLPKHVGAALLLHVARGQGTHNGLVAPRVVPPCQQGLVPRLALGWRSTGAQTAPRSGGREKERQGCSGGKDTREGRCACVLCVCVCVCV